MKILESNLAIVENYYKLFAKKNIEAMAKYLHPDVQFTAPLAKIVGKDLFLKAARKLASLFNTLTIRAKFSTGDQVMLAYDFDFPGPIGKIPTAALLTMQDGLITKIELFYDARPFEKS